MENVYNMVSYKSKVMRVEDVTLNLLPNRQNSNTYPREDNNSSDNSSTFITDDEHLRETVIPDNTYISSNKIP